VSAHPASGSFCSPQVKLTVPPQARRAAWVWRPSPTTMVGMTLPTNIKVELDRLFYDSN